MDDVFGYLLQKLTEYGILDHTNILLLSDHGNYARKINSF
jgi:arylsulfatase A-like enzyme